MTKKTVVITNDFNNNIDEVSKLIVNALKKSTSIPQLSADTFMVRLHLAVRIKYWKWDDFNYCLKST
jgi:hypothetical protein